MCQKDTRQKETKNAPGFERAKHKTTSCVPYKREERVSSTIITFCPVNLDKKQLAETNERTLVIRSSYANCRRKRIHKN